MAKLRFEGKFAGIDVMTSPEIERLVAEAIDNRPKITKAAMNLYIHNGKLICGARAVMPKDAAFIAHVPPDRLENGFNEKEWKLIVKKIESILAGVPAAATVLQPETKTKLEKATERRNEKRLRYYQPIWFSENFNKRPLQGQMVDVSSRGIAFTCDSNEPYVCSGQRLTTRFSVPRFDSGRFPNMASFERTGCVCRVDDSNGLSRRIAIQFAEPLPFRPGEQSRNPVRDALR
jgi:hypothetical protein